MLSCYFGSKPVFVCRMKSALKCIRNFKRFCFKALNILKNKQTCFVGKTHSHIHTHKYTYPHSFNRSLIRRTWLTYWVLTVCQPGVSTSQILSPTTHYSFLKQTVFLLPFYHHLYNSDKLLELKSVEQIAQGHIH